MIAMNAPVILNQALTVHGEVSIHPGATQGVMSTVVARETLLCHFEPKANSLGWKSCYISGYVLGSGLSNPTFR